MTVEDPTYPRTIVTDKHIELTVGTDPFPYWVVRNYWGISSLRWAVREMPDPHDERWQRYDNEREKKLAIEKIGVFGKHSRSIESELMSDWFSEALTAVTGIPDLIGDMVGGGYHRIEPGGMLDTHVDFNRSSTGLYRRLNCLVYLNEGWRESDGGHLELRRSPEDEEPAVRILPTSNTMVLFETSETSWHGHPEPLPGPRPRLSIAAYYYTKAAPEGVAADAPAHSTIFAGEGE